jgi:hypothetical protein
MFESSLIVRAARPRDADTEVKPSVCDPTERGAPTPRPSGGLRADPERARGRHHAVPATGHGGELTTHWQLSPAGRLVASWSPRLAFNERRVIAARVAGSPPGGEPMMAGDLCAASDSMDRGFSCL